MTPLEEDTTCVWFKVPRFRAHADPNFRRTEMSRVHELAEQMRNGTWELSQSRAKICAMNHDIISAALWSLSGFDPALVHLAEFREHLAHLNEEDPRRHTLDRLISVYVEGQCRELLIGAGITTQEADQMTMERIPDPAPTVFQILACTDHPLAIELMGYALRLGSITAHGQAPWNRFKAVMADCFAQQRQPTSA